MKKILFGIIAVFIASNACAFNGSNGGFTGPTADSVKITTVQDALNMRDDTQVVLRGHIMESLGDEKYTFMDETGTVIIEIDDEDWRGVNATPETIVEIFGEVDKGWFKKTKIDVDYITVK